MDQPTSPPPGRVSRLRRRRGLLVGLAATTLVSAMLAIVPSHATTAPSADPAAHTAALPDDVPAPPPGWSTVFSDDFNGAAGSGLDTANWLYDLGTSYPGGAGNWGTGEVESETNSTSNVYQDGAGHLVIKPIEANGAWTSGRVETQATDFAAPAGGELQLTASIEQPNPANGLGYWPAFWAMGGAARGVGATNWPSIGEMDIMEDVNALSEVSHTFHCGVDPGGPCNETNGISSGLLGCAGCQTGYHTYSVIIDRTNTSAEALRFETDGVVQFTVNENQVPTATWVAAVDHGFFMILDVAIGGSYPNKVCGCTSPGAGISSGAGMSVDYVAAYETTGGGTTPPPTSPPPSGGDTNAYAPIPAASAPTVNGGSVESTSDTGGGQDLGQLANGAYLEYPTVDFGTTGATQFYGRVASGAAGGVSGLIDVRLDSPTAAPIGSFAVANTGGWQSWRTVPANISKVTGTHAVYLTFDSGQPAPFVSVNWFDFGP